MGERLNPVGSRQSVQPTVLCTRRFERLTRVQRVSVFPALSAKAFLFQKKAFRERKLILKIQMLSRAINKFKYKGICDSMDCPNRETNLAKCTCTYPGCPRKGMCCECIRHHREIGEIPGCLFPSGIEKTFDRSVKKFVETQKR